MNFQLDKFCLKYKKQFSYQL